MAKDQSKKIVWHAYDHIKEEKSVDWFWIVGIVAAALAVLFIFFNNIFMAIIIVLGAFVAIMLGHSTPRVVEFEINRRGIRIADTLYTYANLEAFYIVDEDGYERDRIILRSKKMFMPLIVAPLGDEVEIEEVRDYLLNFLPEEEMYEPISERIANRIGL